MAVPQYIMLMSDDYNPTNIQKTPDIDLYNKMGCFTCNQKFQGSDKTWRKAKVKNQKFHSTEERTSDFAARLAPTDPLGYVW